MGAGGTYESICALCLQSRPLLERHVIPAWAYRRTRGGRAQAVQLNVSHPRGPIATRSNAERSIPLLCEECEARVKVFNDAAAEVTLQLDDTFPLADQTAVLDNRFRSCLHPKRLELQRFVYSLFWRAAAYNRVASAHHKLPVEMESIYEEVREHLLSAAPEPEAALVTLTAFTVEPQESAKVMAFNDHATRLSRPEAGLAHLCFLHGVEFVMIVSSGGRALPRCYSFREPTFPNRGGVR